MSVKNMRALWPEVVLFAIAAVAFGHLWWVARESPYEWLTSGWAYPVILVHDPSRLLLASALLLVARRWSRLVAVALAAQPLLYVVYYHLDAHSFQFCFVRASPVYLVVAQGVLAGAIVGVGAVRLLSGVVRRSRKFRTGLIVLLVLSALGWVSSALATGRCEEIVADFVAREVYSGQPFAVVEDRDAWSPPEDVFRRVGAHIVQWKASGRQEGVGLVSLWSAHPAPFVVKGTIRRDSLLLRWVSRTDGPTHSPVLRGPWPCREAEVRRALVGVGRYLRAPGRRLPVAGRGQSLVEGRDEARAMSRGSWAPGPGRGVLMSYLSAGAALAIFRVALLVWVEHEQHHGWTTMDDYLMWGLYPEGLLSLHTSLGLVYFRPSSYGYFLCWGSIVVFLSFIMATPILLVGWLVRRRRQKLARS